MSDEKTFTQEQLDAILKERLGKEKAKFDAAFAERETALAKREFSLAAREVLCSRGFDAGLLDALNTESHEAFEKSLTLVEEQIKAGLAASGHALAESGGVGFDGTTPPEMAQNTLRTAMGLV